MIIHNQTINYRNRKIIKVELPAYSKILSCDFKGEELVFWYLFPDTHVNDLQTRELLVLRTGESFRSQNEPVFIGTAYDRNIDSPFVLHLFEIIQTITETPSTPSGEAIFPRLKEKDLSGWSYDYSFLKKLTEKIIEIDGGEDISMEQTEAVLLAISYPESIPPVQETVQQAKINDLVEDVESRLELYPDDSILKQMLVKIRGLSEQEGEAVEEDELFDELVSKFYNSYDEVDLALLKTQYKIIRK